MATISLNQIKEDPSILIEMGGQKVNIYSGEHGAYYRPISRGYTWEKKEAGIYTLQEAYEATSHCCDKKQIEYRPFEFIYSNSTPKPKATLSGAQLVETICKMLEDEKELLYDSAILRKIKNIDNLFDIV
jgi:hypothetical protein